MATAARIDSFDALRVLSAFGIVAFHLGAGWTRTVGYAGLIAFLLMMFILIGGASHESRTLWAVVRQRAKRLLIPWLAWWCVYLAVALRLHALVLDRTVIFAGPAIHLWFLPYAFISCVCGHAIVRRTRKLSDLRGVVFHAGVGMLLLAVLPTLAARVDWWPLAEWWVATPTLFFGLALGRTLGMMSGRRAIGVLVVVAGILVASAKNLGGDNPTAAYAYVGGGLAVGAALLFQGRTRAIVSRLSELTLGVYLIHPLVNLVLVKFFGLDGGLPRIGVVFVGSCAAIAVLRQSRWGRSVT